jgi:hypothetical protein
MEVYGTETDFRDPLLNSELHKYIGIALGLHYINSDCDDLIVTEPGLTLHYVFT